MEAVSYYRFSPRRQAAECVSIETQAARIHPYCQAQGWQLAVECEDREASGGSMDGRPGLEQALAEACQRKAVLVVYSLSRLARSTKDALEIADRLNAAGAHLASLHEHIDTTSAMGRFAFTLFAALAQLEREQIAERTSDAMLRRQSDGESMGGNPPAGKMRVEVGTKMVRNDETGKFEVKPVCRLEDCPEEVGVIASIIAIRQQHPNWNGQRIANVLRDQKIKFRDGWMDRKTVDRILAKNSPALDPVNRV